MKWIHLKHVLGERPCSDLFSGGALSRDMLRMRTSCGRSQRTPGRVGETIPSPGRHHGFHSSCMPALNNGPSALRGL